MWIAEITFHFNINVEIQKSGTQDYGAWIEHGNLGQGSWVAEFGQDDEDVYN